AIGVVGILLDRPLPALHETGRHAHDQAEALLEALSAFRLLPRANLSLQVVELLVDTRFQEPLSRALSALAQIFHVAGAFSLEPHEDSGEIAIDERVVPRDRGHPGVEHL